MSGTVNLSILLTTHTEKAHFDALLLSLTRINHPGVELIIINDAAGEQLSQFIQQVLSDSKNEQIYYFEHDSETGRGNCLNEGLTQASGMFIWAPLKAQRINESLLIEGIRRYKSDPAAFWTLDYSLPEQPMEWINAASEGDLPDDSCLIWNRSVIKPKHLFFNPFLNKLHGAELALRLQEDNVWHKTDPFFVLSDQQSPIAGSHDLKEFYYSLLRQSLPSEIRKQLEEKLIHNPSENDQKKMDDDQLIQSRQFLNQGDANKALDIITKFLKKSPNHHEANRIKISALEKLRRHVEAAELKHQLQLMDKLPKEQVDLFKGEKNNASSQVNPDDIEFSIIIPSAGAGKALLESALMYIEEVATPSITEVIVIDNASIDDTFEYLSQLKQKNFFNIKVITNSVNKGFGASVNQGIDASCGNYILVMHNDVYLETDTITHLKSALIEDDSIALAAPTLNYSDYPNQLESDAVGLIPVDRVDSCCFMIKCGLSIKFDEDYGLCHFDIDDFCLQLLELDKKAVVVPTALAKHEQAKTTEMMGVKLLPKLKWVNRNRFNKKWSNPIAYSVSKQGTHPDRLQSIGIPDDPLNPDLEWVHAIQSYLTDEVKTEILRTEWDENELACIVTALLIADERELLRTLEDRLDFIELPTALLLLFVEYYFNKNIYSRCRHYLDKAGNSHPAFDLYRLKILVSDKDVDEASSLLKKLLNKYPASADLFTLAGDLYRSSGEESEAQSFYSLASQIDPYRFSAEAAGFELNK